MERSTCSRPLPSFFLFLLAFFFWFPAAHALVYLQGQVTYKGSAYTGEASVSLSCNASSYKYASAWGSINSFGEYSFNSTSDSYNPCSSTNKDVKWDCKGYASQWKDTKIANSKEVAITLDCSKTRRQDYALTPKNLMIKVSLQDSSKKAITTGMSVSCYQNVSPWGYGSANSSTDGVYPVPVTEGTYTCSAYCDWNTWKGNCPYSGNPQVSVTVGASDTTVTPSALVFSTKDKTICVTVKAGSITVKNDISVNCSQNTSPWSYGSTSTATSSGCYEVKVTSGTFNCNASCSTWPCKYSGYPTKLVSVADSDTVVSAELKYAVKDKDLYVKIKAGESSITSGVSAYCNQQGGSWDYASATTAQSDGRYKLSLGEGIYTCSAYCTNYQSCDVSGYPRAKVEFAEADTTAEATLTFLKKDSTISGIVTDGKNGISNVYVSVNSYQVKGKTGAGTAALVTKEINWIGKLATVTSEETSTQVYAGANTTGNGSFEIRIPAGTYKVSVYAPYGSDLGPAEVEVTAKADTTTSVPLVLPKMGGKIVGCVTDASGNPVPKFWANASSYNGASYAGHWVSAPGDSKGCFSLNVLEKRVYTVNVNVNTWGDTSTNLCSHSNEGNKSVTTTSGTVTVDFTIPNCDCKVTVNAVDASGNLVPTISGSVDAKPTSAKSNEYFYGIWGQITGGTGTVKVVADKEYKFKGWFYDSKYSGDTESNGTCTKGAGKVDLILAKKIKDAVTGSFVDGDGNSVSLDKVSYLSVNATKGGSYSYCNVDLKKYSCDLSPGDWSIGYWIDPGSGYASSGIGTASNKVTITEAGGAKKDLTLLVTGSIEATVLNIDGSGRPNTSVTCNPFSGEGKNDYQYLYSSGWCQSDGNGKCKMNVGAASGKGTDYYCMANIPYGMKLNEGLNNPKETKVNILPGKTAAVKLPYEKADGKVTITVKEGNLARSALTLGTAMRGDEEDLPLLRTVINATKDAADAASPVANATVDCFSSKGGSYEVKADALGVATCLCATNDTWYAVAHNLVGNALYISKATQVPCKTDGATGTATIDFVTTVPEGESKTVTDAATQSLNIALSDGFGVFFPAGSLAGKDEQATAKVEVSLTPITSTQIPVSYYAYNVSAFDSKNAAIVQLKSDATFTVPYKKTQIDKMGLTENEIRPCYFNTSEGSYTTITTAAMDKEKKSISYTQNHLTDYAVIGNGYLGALQGQDKGAVGVAKGEDGTATGAGANGAGDGTGSSGGGDSSSGTAAGCGGCYTMAHGATLDDRLLWSFVILLWGLRRLLRPATRTQPLRRSRN